jgi:hypothetical protein
VADPVASVPAPPHVEETGAPPEAEKPEQPLSGVAQEKRSGITWSAAGRIGIPREGLYETAQPIVFLRVENCLKTFHFSFSYFFPSFFPQLRNARQKLTTALSFNAGVDKTAKRQSTSEIRHCSRSE